MTDGNDTDPTCSEPLYYKAKITGGFGGEKNLTKNSNDTYNLTIDSYATGNYQGKTDPVPPSGEKKDVDIVLVVDQSGSMRTADLVGEGMTPSYTQAGGGKTDWSISELKNGTQYYYEKDGKYYPVQMKRGNLFVGPYSVRGNETFGWGNDGISLMVNGAPTYYNVKTFYYVMTTDPVTHKQEMHRLRAITAGLDLHYGFYPYVYLDENNEYAQMGKWKDNHYWFRFVSPWGANKLKGNSRWNTIVSANNPDVISFIDTDGNLLGDSDEACNSAKMNYSWVTNTARMNNLYIAYGRGYTNLYYVDDNGNEVTISNTRYFSKDKAFETTGPLYVVSNGLKRVTALENAVTDFVSDLQKAETANGKTYRLAIVGYAQNAAAIDAPSAAAVNEGAIVLNGQVNTYANTGLFGGTNYKTFTNYVPTYAGALQDVSNVSFSSGTFGAWGGTYPAYGMAMAKQIFDANSSNADKVVIFFTDGEPGSYSYEEGAANDALANGAEVKGMNAKVFTIGLFPQTASADAESFLQYLSSDYTGSFSEVSFSKNDDLSADSTYFYKDANGKYSAICTNEDLLGWWEYNADGTYTLLNVKGKNAGAGEEYLYDGSTEVTGEDADPETTYKSARGNDVHYEYRWYDANQSVADGDSDALVYVNPVELKPLYAFTQERTAAGHYQSAATAQAIKDAFSSIQTDVTKTVITDEGQEAQPVSYNGETAYVQDTISNYFEAPAAANVTAQLVRAQLDANGSVQWLDENGVNVGSADAAQKKAFDGNLNVTGKSIHADGYNFSENYIREGHPGWVLRITVNGLNPTVTGPVYSNVEPKSGIYKTKGNEQLYSFNNPSANVPAYTVVWKVNGEPVETDTGLKYGAKPNFDGETPKDYKADGFAYTFLGWSSVSEQDETGAVNAADLPGITGDMTYYAVFHKEAVKTYNMHWFSEGRSIKDETLESGTYPAYKGETPTSSTPNTYFIGWSKNASFTSVDASTTEAQLQENLYYGSETVDQLDTNSDQDVTLYAVFFTKELTPKTVVVEYSVKHEIATEVYDYEIVSANNGTFQLDIPNGNDKGTLSYTPNTGMKSGAADLTAMAKTSVADYYTNAPAEDLANTSITRVTVVPGSSIYFDDSLESATVKLDKMDQNGRYDYRVALAKQDVNDAEAMQKGETRTFTFQGTRIDVYCTTDSSSNSVMATMKMLDADGNLVTAMDKDNKTVSGKQVANKFASGTMYSTPTLSFDNLDPTKTYVLTIRATTADAYRLDGIRVYNPTDNSLNGEDNTNFYKVRDLLTKFDNTEGDGTHNATGAAFVDKDGFSTGKFDPKTYKDYGPKNEVYLAPGQAIAFTVNTEGTVWIGMKSSTGKGLAYVTNEKDKTAVTLDSVVEQYFSVKPTNSGIVVVKNESTAEHELIALTNIKIVGGTTTIPTTPAEGESSTDNAINQTFALNAPAMKSYLRSFNSLAVVEPEVIEEPEPTPSADPEPSPSVSPDPEPTSEPDPEPTQTPSISSIINQIFSSFVSRLFDSISRLFGGK